jgi:hypothetical protein
VGGLVVVSRHLNRQNAPRPKPLRKSWKQGPVIIEPMQSRVGKQNVHGPFGGPSGKIGLDPTKIGLPGPSLRQHFCGRVHTRDDGTWPALRQQSGDVSGAAPEINDCAWRIHVDASDQIQRRT